MEQNMNKNADETVKNIEIKNVSEKNYQLLGSAAILGISSVTAVIAGLLTSHIAKKKNQELLKEIGKEVQPQILLESPYSLAFRALAWGTVWAVGGCSLIAFGIWKWYGFKDMEDLRTRMRRQIKKGPTDEKLEFESLTEFLSYLNEASNEKKEKGT